MADDWTEITDAALAIGGPTRKTDARALRDNPKAIARGAPGAPRISPWAEAREIASGSVVVYQEPLIIQATTTWVSRVEERLLNSGSLQFIWDQRRVSGTGTIRTQVFIRKGTTETAVGAEAETGNTLTTYTRTITGIEWGDTVILRTRMRDSDAAGHITDFRMRTTGALLTPVSPRFIFGSEPT